VRVGLVATLESSPGNTPSVVYRELLEDAVLAESLGYDCVLVGEHHFLDDGYCPAPLTVAAAIAARTSSLRVGSCIAVLPLHHPIAFAEEAAVVDVLSGGRLVLGVGAGYRRREFEGYGVDHVARGARTDAHLHAVLEAWSTSARHGVQPSPVQRPHPPIWVDAASPHGAARAARFGCDPLFPPGPLALLRRQLAHYRSQADFGFDTSRRVVVVRELHVAASRDLAFEECESSLLVTYRDRYRPQRGVIVDDGESSPRAAVDPAEPVFASGRALAQDRMLVGSPDGVIEDVLRYHALGVTDLILIARHRGLAGEQVRSSMRLFAEEVLPMLPAP
jgi:alkanesulfonate monooxygenase SsuD/methylene tetrahydromethanopterin reductase-like flavin-dependent oxidoreductase (luciferase family)